MKRVPETNARHATGRYCAMAIGLLPEDKVVVWYSSAEQSISETMAAFLLPTAGPVADTAARLRTLYFVDAMDRFPVSEFCQCLPPGDNDALFEDVRIMTALDMEELANVVRKIAQLTQMARSAHSRAPQTTPVPHVLVFLRGLDVAFRNTALKDPARAHLLLKDTMLRLRMLANSAQFPTTTVVLFPESQAGAPVRSTGSSGPPFKKQSLGSVHVTSLPAYLSKFYADRTLVLEYAQPS
ncbi:LADA_0E09692g1_1 [Lachancea dasiensis]|uniref:LADA_0E09692g1_1 n=1 Tax=Lachancea dasiensis TaxID=1072105 RepID=A0A1G4JDZ4_9SACH|nr:LADA_0E09692g1_1 [Lachancea dasiensis]